MALLIGIVISTLILFTSSVQSIRDGNRATKGEFPYHAKIDVFDEDSRLPVKSCSGAVISANFVLTTYKCVKGGKRIFATLGCLNRDDEYPACERLRTVALYAEDDARTSTPSTIHNYVALVEVKMIIPFNAYIQPAKLHKADTNLMNSYANATGYWLPHEKEHLHSLSMKVLPMEMCKNKFPEDSLNNSLCVQGEDIDGNERGNLCSETSVPLVVNNVLIGLSKDIYVNNSCESSGLNVFIDVRSHYHWIKEIDNSTLSSRLSMHNATKDDFPHHAHIEVFYDEAIKEIHRNNCSGAVISSLYVISAKHCLRYGTSFRIKLGSLKPDTANDKPAYDHLTRHFPISPRNTIGEDGVALLQLEIEIHFDKNIQAIKLPKPDANFFHFVDSAYYHAIATGYYTDVPRHLQWRIMGVVSNISPCQNVFREDFLNTSLCVVGDYVDLNENENICKDAGGLLVLSDRKTLVGISSAKGCLDFGLKKQFIDVKLYVDWIKSEVNDANVDNGDEFGFSPSIFNSFIKVTIDGNSSFFQVDHD